MQGQRAALADAELCERRRTGFAAGLAAFRLQDFGQAGHIFEALLQELGEDGPARFYLALCKRYRRTSLAAPWDGTVYLDEVLGTSPRARGEVPARAQGRF